MRNSNRFGQWARFVLVCTLAVFCVSGAAFFSAQARAEVVDRIVAIVNEDLILLSELNQAYAPYADQIKSAGYLPGREQEMLATVRTELLDSMIDQKLTDQEIKRLNIIVAEKEVDEAIASIKEANNATDQELVEMLRQQGLTLGEYRLKMKEKILRNRLVDIQVKSKIVVTREDIAAYYQSHPERYGSQIQYHLKNLMVRVRPETGPGEKQAAKQVLSAIHEKLLSDQAYDGSGTLEMDLGWIPFNTLSPQLKDALKGVKPGGFTPVLDTDQGFQVVFVLDVRQSAEKPLEEVSRDIERELYQEVIDQKFKSWLQDLRASSLITIIQ